MGILAISMVEAQFGRSRRVSRWAADLRGGRSRARATLAAEMADRYLPRLERARTELGTLLVETENGRVDLLAATPTEEQRLAALVIVARALRRNEWTDEEELADSTFAQLEGLPPVPTEDVELVGRSYRRMAGAPTRQRCSSCWLTRGRMTCTLCGGTRCAACDQRGTVQCATCNGSGSTLKVALRYTTDTVVDHTRAVMPDMPEPFKYAVRSLIGQAPPPAELKTDLAPGSSGSPYRQRRTAPSFHGHQFGRALPLAHSYVSRIRQLPSIVRLDLEAYAWPLSLVRYDFGGAALVLVAPNGATTVLHE